jgi:hypothetical protein
MRFFFFVSVVLIGLCGLSAATDKADFDASYFWPLTISKRLSSGFGDIRPGRFHMGIDLRTNAKEGYKVYAPEDGHVWRIKTSYRGYGKGLYIKGRSGRLYIYGHLQKFNRDIGSYLRERQIETRRYYQDIYPEAGKLPVKRGRLIARTGQSGAGAPHLHFEVRDTCNRPTNPLYYNKVKIKDTKPPAFEAVWLTYLDEKSLSDNGRREMKMIPAFDRTRSRYLIRDTVIVTGRFAFKAAIEDYISVGSFKLGPSRIRLYIDDMLYHEIEYDRIDYAENHFSLLDRDFDPDKKDYKRIYNLYRKEGNRFSNYRSDIAGDGSFSAAENGYHNVLIEASDPFGNTSRLEFVFYYLADDRILTPMNKVRIDDSLAVLMFIEGKCRAMFDTVALFSSGNDSTRVALYPEIEIAADRIILRGDFTQWQDYRLVFKKSGVAYPSYHFSASTTAPQGGKVIDSVSYGIIDDGVLFTAHSAQPGINWLLAEIVTSEGSERLFYRKTGNNRFSMFYQPGETIDGIEKIITRGPIGFRPDTHSVDIHQVRVGEEILIQLTREIGLFFEAEDLFNDALLHLRDTVMPSPQTGYFVHGPFVLEPVSYAFADWADLQTIPDETADPSKVSLYVYDDENGWRWAVSEYNAGTNILHSRLGGGGVIAVIADTTAPVISGLNIEEKDRIKISRPSIRFVLTDELSGIENDLNFNVTIDDKWIVPEYDPDIDLFISKPHWRLHGGKHTLNIEVIDRCGNKATVTRKFYIGAKTGP